MLASYLGREQVILAESAWFSTVLPPLANSTRLHHNRLRFNINITLQIIQLLGINGRVQNSVVYIK
jgi:hypothetical protein